jgi:hypothetical protein
MIKKIVLTSLALGFAFSILGISIFKTSFKTLAQGNDNQEMFLEVTEATASEEASEEGETKPLPSSATETEEGKVDYYLPYPGILPDHPLYFLKMIRDRIELFFTTQPLKRAEKLLHYADKRIGAAQALVEGNKVRLGMTTATKAEKYLERAINQEEKARGEGIETRPFLEKLAKACLKHEEILLKIKEKTRGEEQVLEQILSYPQQGYKEVKERLEK